MGLTITWIKLNGQRMSVDTSMKDRKKPYHFPSRPIEKVNSTRDKNLLIK